MERKGEQNLLGIVGSAGNSTLGFGSSCAIGGGRGRGTTSSAKEGGPGVRRVVGDAKGGWRGGVSAGAGVWGAVQGGEPGCGWWLFGPRGKWRRSTARAVFVYECDN
jgi:hypothetical protein